MVFRLERRGPKILDPVKDEELVHEIITFNQHVSSVSRSKNPSNLFPPLHLDAPLTSLTCKHPASHKESRSFETYKLKNNVQRAYLVISKWIGWTKNEIGRFRNGWGKETGRNVVALMIYGIAWYYGVIISLVFALLATRLLYPDSRLIKIISKDRSGPKSISSKPLKPPGSTRHKHNKHKRQSSRTPGGLYEVDSDPQGEDSSRSPLLSSSSIVPSPSSSEDSEYEDVDEEEDQDDPLPEDRAAALADEVALLFQQSDGEGSDLASNIGSTLRRGGRLGLDRLAVNAGDRNGTHSAPVSPSTSVATSIGDRPLPSPALTAFSPPRPSNTSGLSGDADMTEEPPIAEEAGEPTTSSTSPKRKKTFHEAWAPVIKKYGHPIQIFCADLADGGERWEWLFDPTNGQAFSSDKESSESSSTSTAAGENENKKNKRLIQDGEKISLRPRELSLEFVEASRKWLALHILGIALGFLVLNGQVLCKVLGLLVGFWLWGKPAIGLALVLADRWTGGPEWRDTLEMRNSMLFGVPTHAQKTFYTLLEAERQGTPLVLPRPNSSSASHARNQSSSDTITPRSGTVSSTPTTATMMTTAPGAGVGAGAAEDSDAESSNPDVSPSPLDDQEAPPPFAAATTTQPQPRRESGMQKFGRFMKKAVEIGELGSDIVSGQKNWKVEVGNLGRRGVDALASRTLGDGFVKLVRTETEGGAASFFAHYSSRPGHIVLTPTNQVPPSASTDSLTSAPRQGSTSSLSSPFDSDAVSPSSPSQTSQSSSISQGSSSCPHVSFLTGIAIGHKPRRCLVTIPFDQIRSIRKTGGKDGNTDLGGLVGFGVGWDGIVIEEIVRADEDTSTTSTTLDGEEAEETKRQKKKMNKRKGKKKVHVFSGVARRDELFRRIITGMGWDPTSEKAKEMGKWVLD